MVRLKRKTRKKLAKQLGKLVKRHGSEIAIGLVTGIISNLVSDNDDKRAASRRRAADSATTPVRRPREQRSRTR